MNEPIHYKHLLESLDRQFAIEAKGHLDHPEDLIVLDGTRGASRAVDAILNCSKNPQAVTIKWDGYPALIFGRDSSNKFSIMDKHMFNRKDGLGRKIYSPDNFAEYDRQRGVDRAELTNLIRNIWPGLQKASKGTQGYYWGDLLFSQPLKNQKGDFKFKANPNGITYVVKVDSDVGQLLQNKIAGLAVHQYLNPTAATTDDAVSLDGTLGGLSNNSDVAILPSAMPIVPSITIDKTLIANAKNAISKYGKSVEQLLSTAPQARNTFNQLFTKYINKKIVSNDLSNMSNGFLDYFEQLPMTDSMRKKLSDHINNNKNGIVGLFTIWAALYQLKMTVVDQLNQASESSPVKGYLDSGQQSQEGFVCQGLKFVDRLGFSRQNLAGR